MDIFFKQNSNGKYVGYVTITDVCALHLEREADASFEIRQTHVRGGKYSTINGVDGRIFTKDIDLPLKPVVHPVYLELISGSPVTNSRIVYNGNEEEGGDVDGEQKVYAGCVQATKSEFAALPDSAFENMTPRHIGTSSFIADKNCFVLLVPNGVTIQSVSFMSESILNTITESSNIAHANVVVKGQEYSVYGYRLNTVNANNPQQFDFVTK